MVKKQVVFRLDENLIKRLDEYVDYVNKLLPGINANRTDAARMLFIKALDTQLPKTEDKK